MQKKMGFNQYQQCYGDEGMRMDARSEEESYFFQEESWSFDNKNHHKQHPAMHMNGFGAYEHFMLNQPCKVGNFQEPMHNYHDVRRGGGRRLPYGGIGSGGDGRLIPHHEYLSEQTKYYEESYREKHKGEMRYHHENNWGEETCYERKNKPHKVQWTTKGI